MSWQKIVTGLLCLLLGCAMYLVLRSDTIRLYQWCQATVGTGAIEPLREIAKGWNVPFFVRFSLPDGLYCLSYILIADGIMNGESGFWRYAIVTFIPVVALIHECLQYAGVAHGYFDPGDLIAYSLPLLAYIVYRVCARR